MTFRAALLLALLATSAQAIPAGADVERAATRVAAALDGVLRNCPVSFTKVGTGGKRCVGSGLTVEQVRVKLVGSLGSDLYGVWRSRDEQRSVYNWVRTPAGYVYLRLQADPDGRAQTLVYLDVPLESALPASSSTSSGSASPASVSPASAPPVSAQTTPAPGMGAAPAPTGGTQIGSVTLTPAAPAEPRTEAVRPELSRTDPAKTDPAKTDQVKPEPATTPVPGTEAPKPDVPTAAGSAAASTPPPTASTPTPAASAPSVAPVPYRRVLQLQAKRMNGADVVAVQNRLISLMRPARVGKGDGWYGPVTAAAVRAFQKASGLALTGRVDRPTWDALFSAGARTFTPPG